ncbi:hypothetical protein AB1L88_07595 [Tautonia sp. JC769]|uniref:hypothetical protein n=1 Tax=Tautonia sp. JC769 TaxID=3232135 RepID=UPI003458333D
MSSPDPDLRSRLEHARSAGSLVRIARSFTDGWEDGYVLGIGPDLVLLAVVGHGIRLDGYQVYRLDDITRLEDPAPHAAFVESALKLRGLAHPSPPSVNLDSLPDLLRTATDAFSLLTIHTEDEDPEVCWIGQVVETHPDRVVLRHITPDASWDDLPDSYPLDEVTRIDFGGSYEEALWLVANAADQTDGTAS